MNIVNLINPEGKLVGVPEDYAKEAIKPENGYTFPQNVLDASDLSSDGKLVNVTNPKGEKVAIPVEHWASGEALKQGYKKAAYQLEAQIQYSEVQKQIESDKNRAVFDLDDDKSYNTRDEKGNYLLKTPGGEVITVKPDEVQNYLIPGPNQLRFANPKAQAVFEREFSEQGDTTTKGAAAASGFNKGISFGLLTKAVDEGASLSNILDLQNISGKVSVSQSEELSKLQGHGELAGTVGSLFIPVPGAAAVKGLGIAGKLAGEGAGLLRQVAARAAAGAVEGAIVNAPQALIQGAIMKDVKGSAESLGLGIGIGALLGGGGRLLGAGLEKAGVLGSRLAESKAPGVLTALGASEDTLKAINAAGVKDEQLVKTLLDHGISGTATPAKMEEGLRRLSSAEHLTSTLSSLDKVGQAVPAEGLLKKISTASEGGQLSLGMLRDPATEKAISNLSTKLAEKAGPKGELTLSNLQKYTAEVGHDINWAVSDNAANNIKKQIYKDATATLLEAGDLAALKSNAKTAASWAEGKVMARASEEMREQLIKDIADGKLTQKLSPMAQKLSDMMTSKASGIAGGAAGAMLGGLPGAIVGGAVGEKVSGAIKGYTDKLAEKYLANTDNGSKLSGWLTKNKASAAVGSYVAMDALHSVGEKVANIAPFVNDLSVKTPAMFASHADPMLQILGSEAKGLSKQEQYTKLSNQIAKISGNPDLLAQQAQELTASIGNNHPELAAQIQQDFTNKVQYLQQVLHGKNNSDVAVPFKKQQEYKPTTSDLKDIEDQLKIAQNPFALMEGLKNGKVTAKQVATASVLNPAILEQMRAEITKEAYSGKSNLTYQQRLAASTIMGQPMDPSLKMLPQLQAVYGGQQQQGQPGAPPAPQGKAPKMNVSKMPSAQGTMGQRISGK